jgi:RNA polymerase sigma factor (sigma-70 family)
MRRLLRPLESASDADLVERCVAGHEDAWAELLERYKGLIYSIPFRYGATAADADDIFQAVVVDLLQELPKLRAVGALKSWIATITTHRAFHWKRRRKNDPAQPAEDDETPTEIAAEGPDAAEVIVEVQRQQGVREALRELPERCRRMIRMLFFDDPPKPYKEVAEQLGLAIGSIGFIRGRCLEKLERRLRAAGV